MPTTSLDGPRTKLELLFNDCSLEGQFRNATEFGEAVGRIMAIRQTARRYGKEVHCHLNVATARVIGDLPMMQVAQFLNKDQSRALLQWMTKSGPFWDEDRQHGEDDWFAIGNLVVTDTAVGEAAYCVLHGTPRALVSASPSSWLATPLEIEWHETGRKRTCSVENVWNRAQIDAFLTGLPSSLTSWKTLDQEAKRRFPGLTFSEDSFAELGGQPFNKRAAERLLERLEVLAELKTSFDVNGQRTERGHAIYAKHFTGDKAWFSDSSDTEKVAFRRAMTFRHPTNPAESLFCTWHGKVKSPQLRIHFSWPIRANEPLYIVYVGPKITKR